ncbi:hypothetical protein Dd703_3546 [Musicola paradisiaca Ech703]|uniref:Uncharacterized protein n=1 Tax=Musicola paradisiaca (strain Ech703) TaxID=579405 RepID=C6C3X7_MUSP7|nr:hypothetical protein Dd703_3546 [Musicola paradisiaca Ech703]
MQYSSQSARQLKIWRVNPTLILIHASAGHRFVYPGKNA